MTEITFSPNQLETASGMLQDAVQSSFNSGQVNKNLYVADASQVPRPDYSQVYGDLIEQRARPQKGSFIIAHSDFFLHRVIMNYPGLRGIAHANVQTGNGVQRISGPAIVLPDKKGLAILTAENMTSDEAEPTDMRDALLEAEYVKSLATPSSRHTEQDIINPGDIAPGLVVVGAGKRIANAKVANAHDLLHALAPKQGDQPKFGIAFANQGLQDIAVGQKTRSVRSTILPLNALVFQLALRYQVPIDKQLFGLAGSSGELAVAMTLGAGISRGEAPDLGANLKSMVA